MKVTALKGANNVYSSNAYIVTGDWKRIEDMNTLIDVGSDPSVIDSLQEVATGIGKSKVEQVILTHDHSDHTRILPMIRQIFNPVVYAFSPFMNGVDHVLKNGQTLRIGDREFEVIHIPGHSDDSIALYSEEDGILFLGDAPIPVRSPGGTYEPGFIHALKILCRKNIRIIYPGHGEPIREGAHAQVKSSLCVVLQSIKRGRVLSITEGGEGENM
jgi:glyoxylase-like metal-dependent hydrolase (beta-lactamase superfamily II)